MTTSVVEVAEFNGAAATRTTATFSFSATPMAGDVVLLVCTHYRSNDSLTFSVTGMGATWNEAGYSAPGGNTSTIQVFTASPTSAGDITVTSSVTNGWRGGYYAFLVRGAPAGAVASFVGTSSTTGSLTSTLTSAGPGQLVVGVQALSGTSSTSTWLDFSSRTPAADWTLRSPLAGGPYMTTSAIYRTPSVTEAHQLGDSGAGRYMQMAFITLGVPQVISTGSAHSTSAGATQTFPAVPLGDEATDRYVIAAVSAAGSAGVSSVAVTVGGVPLSQQVFAGFAGSGVATWIGWAKVPTGTTATVEATFDASVSACDVGVWTAVAPSLALIDSATGSASSGTNVTLLGDDGGLVIGKSFSSAPTWTGTNWGAEISQDYFDNYGAGSKSSGGHGRVTNGYMSANIGWAATTVATYGMASIAFLDEETEAHAAFLGYGFTTAAGAVQTFAGIAGGTNPADRTVIVAATARGTATLSTASVTVGGVALDEIVFGGYTGTGSSVWIGSRRLTGTNTGVVEVTYDASVLRGDAAVWMAYGATVSVLESVAAPSVDNDWADSLDTVDGGFAVVKAFSGDSTTTGFTYTGAVQDYYRAYVSTGKGGSAHAPTLAGPTAFAVIWNTSAANSAVGAATFEVVASSPAPAWSAALGAKSVTLALGATELRGVVGAE